MASQYSHYKPEQGEWLGQKHKADIYSVGPMGPDIKVGHRGPQELFKLRGGMGTHSLMFTCSLRSMSLEIKSLHNDTMYVIGVNHSSLKRYAKLVIVTFAFGGTTLS